MINIFIALNIEMPFTKNFYHLNRERNSDVRRESLVTKQRKDVEALISDPI